MFVTKLNFSSKKEQEQFELLVKTCQSVKSKGQRINRSKLDKVFNSLVVAMIGSQKESQIVRPVKNVSFTIKRNVAKEKQQQRQEKQEKKMLKKQAEKKGLIGIAPQVEEKIPHMKRFEEEKVKVERIRINKTQAFQQIVIPAVVSGIAFYYNLVSNIHNGVCLSTVMILNIILGLIARRRAQKFRNYFESMTGYSFKQIEDIEEEQIGIKTVKLMNVLVQEREDEVDDSYVEGWAINKYEYNLIEVLKNNVRSKYLESIIIEKTLKEVKETRKEQYDEIQAIKNRYTISSIIHFIWNMIVFIYDHKGILSILLLSGGLVKKIGYINTIKYMFNAVKSTITLTQGFTTTAVNVASTASSAATNVVGSVLSWFN